MSTERDEQARAFLKRAGWDGAAVAPLPGDASTRHYARVSRNGRGAMLMDQPQLAETPAAPPNATPEERTALGYNAVARLASGDVGRFVAVANYLRGLGLSAPEIYAADPVAGFALIEDLGDDLYADALAKGGDERTLYTTAAGVLARLHAHDAPALLPPDTPLHAYDETAQIAEIDLMTEWFVPYALNRAATDAETAEHRALWRDALAKVRGARPVFVHRDYHAQNLLWLPDRTGAARVGLIDFQDAVAGSPAQDLMHLIEDARRDVSPETSAATVRHYLDTMRDAGRSVDEDAFAAEMATISGQRNARIVGIFSRLYKRDGKPRYLAYLPRVWRHLNRDLEHPALAPLKSWYDKTIPRAARGPVGGVAG
jgi:aminoglycoside/choline kinase family phosphotransferase